ncbi:hypothetical protein Goshw_002165 [Gossypium schwendimanii]|uniref:Uncharacterized protein n=1 Tax=Gossypium schwendimanii TaxID=34291 RepID=A0A7J9MLT4_GOSSC|nr:hypothetical protein [Gossypium schwendimanii]
MELSWKDKLIGKGVVGFHDSSDGSDKGLEEDFDLLEGDITRSMVNGVLFIESSNRVQQLLVKGMATTVYIKGKFAQISIFLNLDKPLIPQVLVNGRAQRVEYEALISAQLEAKSRKAYLSTVGDLQKESINPEQ